MFFRCDAFSSILFQPFLTKNNMNIPYALATKARFFYLSFLLILQPFASLLAQAPSTCNSQTLWAWGANPEGQFGNNSSVSNGIPAQIGSNDWRIVAAGFLHTVALKNDGSLWTWGGGSGGQLGYTTNLSVNPPTQIGSDHDWKAVDAGSVHTVALKNDGTLWTWGNNFAGQLGDGSNTSRDTPQQVGSDNDWKSIEAGNQGTFAIKTDGSLWGWGSNIDGAIGNGSFTNSNIPVKIGLDNDWRSVSAGFYQTVAVKTDGSLWSWGYYKNVQVASYTSTNIPLQVGSDYDWVSAQTGGSHALALKSNRTLWAWGYNAFGQLGNGTFITSTPVQVGVDADWKSFSVGVHHSLALKINGSLWAWGRNFEQQLGNGLSVNSNIPLQIGSETDWKYISAGYYYNLALKTYNFMPPAITGTTSICQGSSATLTASGGSSYAWSTESTDASITVSPTTTTTYIVTVTDANGCSGTASATVDVKTTPNAPYSVHFFDCGSTRPKAHSTPYGTNQTFEWYSNANHTGDKIPSSRAFDGPNEISLIENSIDNFCPSCTTVINKTYYVFEVSANGCYSPATEVPITVFPVPKTTPDVSNTFGCGNSIAVLANGHGNIVEWRTSYNSLAGSTLATGETYNATENQSIYATEIKEFLFTPTKPLPVSETTLRCYGGATPVNIILKPAPPAPIVSDISLCVGDVPQPIFTNPNYVWYTLAENYQHAPAVIINTDAPSTATYFIGQIVDGCKSETRTEMHATVNALPSTPSVLSTIQPTCSLSTGTITVSPQAEMTYSFDNGATFQTANTKSGLLAGDYKIKVKNVNGCLSASINVTINPTISNTSIYNITASQTTICVGETVKLSVAPVCATCTYAWSNGKTAPNINVGPSLSTTFVVTVSQNGCASIASKSITVNQKPASPILTVVQPTCSALGSITITNLAAGSYSKIEGGAWVLGKTSYSNLVAGEYEIMVKNACGFTEKDVILSAPTASFDSQKCYKIVNKNSGKSLDVFENRTANFTPIIQYFATSNSNQKWQFSTLNNGFIKIKSQSSNKFLACNSDNNGANIFQFDYIAGGQKDWKIECLGGGDYRIVHKYSSKYLSVENNSKSDRAKIEIRNWNNNEAQKWQIVEVSCVNPANLRQADLLSAKAEGEPQRVNITWYSNLGEKTDYYTVEKLDVKTEEFSTLKTLNNTQFDSDFHTYTIYDASPTEGVNTYRIKAVFNDGKIQTSEAMHVAFGDTKAVRLYPNPAGDFVDIQLPEMPKGEVHLVLYNMFGKPVSEQKFEANQTLHFDLGELPNGVYQLNINRKGKRSMVQQVVIQK
jgi:alpha-tubulin suppressor-like RCC1 family protein